MAEPFLGMIIIVPYNFAPLGWAFCNGQLLPIAQNTALFSLLGTTYGGDGKTNFALPDLRGRVPVHVSLMVPGLSDYFLGQSGGAETVTLAINQLAAHTHPIALNNLAATANVRNAAGNTQSPVLGVPAIEAAGVTATYSNAPPNATMAPGAISVSGAATAGTTGTGQPVPIVQPYLTFNYCIALQGIFPSHN